MKSPFTGGEASLQKEMRTLDFRKEAFKVLFHYYVCQDSQEQFTDDSLDELNINQIYNQYREKYGIPFPDEIKAIREQYGLPASKMAEVLGLGINIYRNYEAGEVPSVSNGRLLQLVKDPNEFRKLFNYCNKEFSKEEADRIYKKIDGATSGWDVVQNKFDEWLLGEKNPNEYNGYRVPNLDKISNMILYFSKRITPFKTKMNKLLFYADFLNFKRTCFSISGLTYKAIQLGPVPKNFGHIFDTVTERRYVDIEIYDFGGYTGERFVETGQKAFEEDLFTDLEVKTLQDVADYFSVIGVTKIVEISHEEDGWLQNVGHFGAISYNYGFDLKYPKPSI